MVQTRLKQKTKSNEILFFQQKKKKPRKKREEGKMVLVKTEDRCSVLEQYVVRLKKHYSRKIRYLLSECLNAERKIASLKEENGRLEHQLRQEKENKHAHLPFLPLPVVKD